MWPGPIVAVMYGDAIAVLLLIVSAVCAFACLALACVAAVKLHEMRALLDLANVRMVELRRHYDDVQH